MSGLSSGWMTYLSVKAIVLGCIMAVMVDTATRTYCPATRASLQCNSSSSCGPTALKYSSDDSVCLGQCAITLETASQRFRSSVVTDGVAVIPCNNTTSNSNIAQCV